MYPMDKNMSPSEIPNCDSLHMKKSEYSHPRNTKETPIITVELSFFENLSFSNDSMERPRLLFPYCSAHQAISLKNEQPRQDKS